MHAARLVFTGIAALGPAIALVACGGGSKTAATPAAASASADAGPPKPSAVVTVTPPPSGLPPMAAMPPPGVAGSKKGKVKQDPQLYACGAGAKASTKDPAELVKRAGEGCATASKMRPLGSPIRGQQADKDPSQEQKLRVQAGKCYRVYFATDANVKDAVLVMRDSNGDVVAESPSFALPEGGSVCFDTADEVSLLLAAGAGKGSYVAQVWSD
ncbi:hypothetical protein AKJ09_11392 [Labilithrix luteola]|uniref:Lipoprotein n=1 Tax=Labilithrix luteola TaxID=1391654 RepID=A0A0K1QG47_9BACT|nr:hypothetical protein [Labilithrix luteola]AKV04729.1 hypothetical protein AKJ09_11392 [Labilithrix luteola]